MASAIRTVPMLLPLLSVVLLSLADAVNSIPPREFDSMLSILRVRGYNLFSNAIVTSDLQFQLLSYQSEGSSRDNNHSLTLFAPTDSSLFALDMTQSASSYTDTLRYHVVPRRYSISDLRRLPSGSSIPTLLLHGRLNITRSSHSDVIRVGGVEIAFPGLYYGRHIAVHGLRGILNLRSQTVGISGSPYPRTGSDPSRINGSGQAPSREEAHPPIPKFTAFNLTNQTRNSPMHDPAQEPTSDGGQSPADSPVYLDSSRPDSPSAGVRGLSPGFAPINADSPEIGSGEMLSPWIEHTISAPWPMTMSPDSEGGTAQNLESVNAAVLVHRKQKSEEEISDLVPEAAARFMEETGEREMLEEVSESSDGRDGCSDDDLSYNSLERIISGTGRHSYMQCRYTF